MEWSKDLLPTAAKYGLGTLLALYFTWFITTSVTGQLIEIRSSVAVHQTETVQLRNAVDSLRNSTDGLKNEQNKTNLILQQICVNGAAVSQRQNCFR